MRILAVEDDPGILRMLERGLAAAGHQVLTADNGEDGAVLASEEGVDVVLLDISLPELSGHEVLARIRARRPALPILMLTARDDLDNKVRALDAGADDYLTKPFAFEELLARIRALLRRSAPRKDTADGALRFEDLELNPATREVSRGGRRIELTPREFGTLEHLMRHPRQVRTRDQVFEAVWGSDYLGGSNVIDVNVKALREKLESEGEPRLIQTVRGVGYCLREY